MVKAEYITIPQLAKILNISRIAVYKKVKKGEIPARKIGGTYVISDRDVTRILHKTINAKEKRQIDAAVRKTVREYGKLLKMLGKE